MSLARQVEAQIHDASFLISGGLQDQVGSLD